MADRIRKINSQTGDVHAVVKTGDALPSNASIWGLAVSANGTVYAVDEAQSVVYKIFEDGRISGTIAGRIGTTGDAISPSSTAATYPVGEAEIVSTHPVSRLNAPVGICVDASDNIYVSSTGKHKIYRLSPSGRCQTLAGNGTAGDVCGSDGLTCQFSSPSGVCVDKAGIVYVADRGNNKIKKIWPSGKTTVLAGAGDGSSGFANGNGNSAKFDTPWAVCADQNGTIYVADTGNYRIRKVDEAGNVVTLAGFANGSVDGVGNTARFGAVYDICINASGVIFALDYGNATIRRVDNSGKVATMMAWDSGTTGSASAIAVDKSGFLYILEKNV